MEKRLLLRVTQRLLRPRQLSYPRHYSSKRSQALPVGDYYSILLESSLADSPSPMTPSAKTPPPVSATTTTKEAEDTSPSIIFSSRLSSPLERRSEIEKASQVIAGVLVPPRPEEPDNCCMSGCVNCVWDRYGDELEEWAVKAKEAQVKLKGEKVKVEESGSEVEAARKKRGTGPSTTSVDDDGGGSDGLWKLGEGKGIGAVAEGEDLFKGVPVGIREFMKQERRLKEKHAREGTVGK